MATNIWFLNNVAFYNLLEILAYHFKFPDGKTLIFLDKTDGYHVTISIYSLQIRGKLLIVI